MALGTTPGALSTSRVDDTTPPDAQHSPAITSSPFELHVASDVPTRGAFRRKHRRWSNFFRDFWIEKSFTLFSLVTSVVIATLCTADLVSRWPWMRASPLFDWSFLFVGIAMFILGCHVFSDQI
ncbi:membrane protein [Rhodopirellula sallentina SM41]|uniref:Membrane protein n=1 Tax=Rhodopirellula sallentina SM41 TaxID=1263870 RepID=M5UBC4_9BACT|nr:membrane protein [Rhodopirellula sallentina SM41]